MARKHCLGHLGAIGKDVLDKYGIEQPVYVLQLFLDTLYARTRGEHTQFEHIANFPPSLRDIAVLVAQDVRAGDLQTTAKEAGGKHLKVVDIFDVYTGDQVPADKKSVALSLAFQADDRTMTDKETQKAWDKILKKFQDNFGAELR